MEAPLMEPKKEKKVRGGGKKQLKAEYARGQTEFPAYVFPEDKYREYILSLSLFPNLYNRANVLSNMR
jgi:hypothetical protein